MDAYLPGVFGVLWGVCAAVLAWNIVHAWRRALAEGGTLPWFEKLARLGLTPARAAEVVGARQLADAARRCMLCRDRAACNAGQPADCPNASTLERLARAGSAE